MPKVAGYLSVFAVACLVASCSSGSSSGSSPASTHANATPHRSSSAQSIAPKPRTFTSHAYGYALTVPASWTPRQAFAKWDGESELDGTSALVDLFGQPSESKGIWAAAARSKRNLAADTAFAIIWNAHYHGDYCPHRPTMKNRVTVGGEPGVLLAYNCGILVNMALTVRQGVEYWFAFIDRGVAAATDPADHATFLRVLSSVRFPH